MSKQIQNFTKEYLETQLQTKYIRQIAYENNCTVYLVKKYMRLYNLIQPNKYEKQYQNLKGKRFNKLVVIDRSSNDRFGKMRLKCKCDCGNYTIVNKSSLIRGLTGSCGCKKTEELRKKGFRDISYKYFRKIIQGAISRNMTFDITIEDVWGQFIKQNGKCAISGVNIKFYPNGNKEKYQTASIDRIDPDKGYTKDNIQIVHKRVNILKGNLTEEELRYWIYNIYQTIKPNGIFFGNHRSILCEYNSRKEMLNEDTENRIIK